VHTLAQLESWYADHCNGDWEHAYGVTIESLDNPGWRVRVDLTHTTLEGRTFVPVRRPEPDPEWIVCEVNDNRFEGAGGPYMLEEILQQFLAWASSPPT